MTTLSRAHLPHPNQLGITRRFNRICDNDGFIRVLAIDHPENYLELFDADITKVSFEEVIRSKLTLISALAPLASAFLLDPVWSFGQAIASGALPGNVGLISGVERLYYRAEGSDFNTDFALRDGWSPQIVADLGGDAAKLVVFYRSDCPQELSSQLHQAVNKVANECHAAQMPLIVEPLWYPLKGEDLNDPDIQDQRTESVISSAASFRHQGADIMKVEFPVQNAEHPRAASALAEMAHGIEGPWVLLSAGVGFEGFLGQLTLAADAGCSGFMAGRSIWGDCVGRLEPQAQLEAVEKAASRLAQLNSVVRERGTPAWQPTPIDDAAGLVPESWHRTQAGLGEENIS